MTFQDAEKRVRELVPDARLITMEWTKDIYASGRINKKARIILVMPSGPTEAFSGDTWAEAIKRLEMYLIPATDTQDQEPDDEEEKNAG